MEKIDKVKKKVKDSIEKTQTIKLVKRLTKSRVDQNSHLYTEENNPDVKPLSENLNLTKQQKFNFDSNKFEDDEKIKKIKNKVKGSKYEIKKELLKAEKQKNIYKKKFYIFLVLFFVLFIGLFLSIYCHIAYEPKVVTKKVEKKVVDENILFLGDSITYRYDLDKYYENYYTVNSGIEGNRINDILDDMKERVYQYNPSKIILLIGTNDLDESYDSSVDEVYNNFKRLLHEIKNNRKLSKVFVVSVYPVNNDIKNSNAKGKTNERIIEYNNKVKRYCEENKYTYIDLHDDLLDENGNLDEDYTVDGLHISDKGYEIITNKIKKYINKK